MIRPILHRAIASIAFVSICGSAALAQFTREDLRDGKDRPAKTALERAAERNANRINDAEEAGQPNIIFFIVDDQYRERINQLPEGRNDDGSPANYTPTLDRMAEQGVILDGMHVPSAVCIPTRFSALTGTYGSRATNDEMRKRFALHGFPPTGQNTHILPGETRTIAHLLKEAGYVTGMVGKNHVVEVKGFKRSRHDEDINDPTVAKRLIDNQDKVRRAFHASGFDYAERLYHDNLHPNGPGALLAHNLDWITEGALEFIEDNHEKPFFLFYSSTLPHGPNAPRYSWRADRRITPIGMLDEPVKILASQWDITKALENAGIEDDHRGNGVWIDSAMAALEAKLEEFGIADNTIIIYFNDHGVEAGKTSVFQGGMQTYSFVYGPDRWIEGERREDALISSVDLAPTMLAWAGADPTVHAATLDGVSAAPVISGQVQATRTSVYGEIGYSRSIRIGDWKYIALRPSPYIEDMSLEDRQAILDKWFARRDAMGRRREANEATDPFPHIMDIPGGVDNTWGPMRKHPHYFDRDQLYNLAEDPNEQVNLAADPAYADILATLRLELADQLADLPGQFGEFPGNGTPAPDMPDTDQSSR
ncbi:MAG: sulfatase-like hydrolase/transferase [Planctomycetota bacterium]